MFCWIASAGHWLDIGGNVPGGFNARATESYQEGVRIPPVKFIREGRLDEDIVDILSANSRVRAAPTMAISTASSTRSRSASGGWPKLLDAYGDETIVVRLRARSPAAPRR